MMYVCECLCVAYACACVCVCAWCTCEYMMCGLHLYHSECVEIRGELLESQVRSLPHPCLVSLSVVYVMLHTSN